MKAPSYKEAQECLRLRKLSKQGHTLARDQQVYVERMFHTYPEWYAAQDHVVFNETRPFGAGGPYD